MTKNDTLMQVVALSAMAAAVAAALWIGGPDEGAAASHDIEAATFLAESVEEELRLAGSAEVTSARVGLAVLERLRDLDDVAYLRFASVYKNFDAAEDFRREAALLDKSPAV